jgi:Flp pilus assembly protein TadD/Zn-dependent protease with chaperone function
MTDSLQSEHTVRVPHAGAARHRRRVLLFATVGYAYLAALSAILIGAIVVLIDAGDARLIWIPGGLLLLVVRALFLRLPVPEGCGVTSAEAPRLFELIEEVRAALRAPRPHRVLLSGDLNAAVLDVARFGVLGSRRLLYIGLPLLQALPADEVRAVLAHELAHLRHRHGRRRARAARLSAIWSCLAATVQWNRNWAAFLLVPFFRWYAPRLEIAVESESRIDEHEADVGAAICAGRAAAARALLRIQLAETYAQRAFWPALRHESTERDTPPDDAIIRLAVAIDGCLAHEDAAAWIGRLLRERAIEDDSHPGLSDRLEALGVPAGPDRADDLLAILRHARGSSSADALLGRDAARRYAVALSEQWETATRNEWRQWHADAQLVRRADRSPLEAAAALRAHARWTALCEPPERAIPVLDAVVQRLPDATEPRLLLAHLLLDDATAGARNRGAHLLEEIMAEESELALTAATLLRRHYARHAASRDVARCLHRQRQLEVAALAALRERSVLRSRDTVRAHPLPALTLATLREQFRSIPEIRRAFLVQKQTKHLRAAPVAVLAIECATPWHRQPAFRRDLHDATVAAVVEQCSLPDAGHVTVFPLRRRGRLHRRLRSIPGAEIYDSAEAFPEPQVADQQWSKPAGALAVLRRPVVAIGGIVLVVSGLLGAGAALLVPSMRSGGSGDSLAARQQTVRDRPDEPQTHLELAWALIDAGRFDEALPPAREAVRLAPDNADAHNTLGWLLLQQRDISSALQTLQTAVRLDPEHRLAHRNLGWALYWLQRREDAEVAFLEAQRIAPDDPDIRLALATVFEDQLRYDEAEAELHHAIRLGPNVPAYRGALGKLLARRGRIDDALAVYRAALLVFPDDARFWREIGVLEHVQARHAKAIEAFRAVERLAPEWFRQDEVARKMLEASLAGRQYQG